MEFNYKKSLGQNFLKDENITMKIANLSEIDKNTLVIEVGPGAGSLSKKIIPLAGYTILYEIDTRLKEILNNNLKDYDNYEIIFGDFLKQDISKINEKYRYQKVYVVANLPYYITTPIITKAMNEIYPDKIVVMIQEEVADRLSAVYGSREYGMISVLLGARYNIRKLFKVSRKSFIPEPHVDSAVICLDKDNKLGNTNYEKFENFIKTAFQFKRKNLKNNLKKYDLELINKILESYHYSLNNRAEDIPINVFIEIAKYL